jgi:hypothetical protein
VQTDPRYGPSQWSVPLKQQTRLLMLRPVLLHLLMLLRPLLMLLLRPLPTQS